ncbi:MAG: hypothetical protein DA328_07780 [Nitrososphaeraceae archaeon]|nr:hypothetical protein [Nitrososphaeraceae archaeon]
MKYFNNKKYYCEQCDKKFDSQDILNTHAKEIHKKTLLKCSNCGKTFLHEKDRLHHMREEKQTEKENRKIKGYK